MIHSSCPVQMIRLSKQLGGRPVLRDIDLTISNGQMVALTGGNGAGKTTLLRCAASIVRPSSGEVLWFGRPAAEHPKQRGQVAIVGHETGLYGQLTLRENLLFAARMQSVRQPSQRVDRRLESAGLRMLADRKVCEVSQGIRRRLAIVRSLIHDPEILLLDEPFSSLDVTGRDWLVMLLRQQRSLGRAICFTTHDQRLAAELADRTLVLEKGVLRDAAGANIRYGRNSSAVLDSGWCAA